MKPVIGINCDYEACSEQGDTEGKCFLKKEYTDAVDIAGGIPFILPIVKDAELLSRIDGLLLSGGSDLSPGRYGEPTHEKSVPVPMLKDDFDFLLAGRALDMDMPILGICYGFQLINVCLGGSLIQDIPSQYETPIEHRTDTGIHNVSIDRASRLYKILKRETMEVNTTHHQAIKDLGEKLSISAKSDDGMIEAAESTAHTFVVGVQWHPEKILEKDTQIDLFRALISTAGTVHEQRIGKGL